MRVVNGSLVVCLSEYLPLRRATLKKKFVSCPAGGHNNGRQQHIFLLICFFPAV